MLTKLVSFLRESKAELKRVTWPSKDRTIRLTGMVIAVTVSVAVLIGILDYLFSLGIGWVVGR